MKNPITKAYKKFDDAIMHLVNKGVRAWNWITGRTKLDLANGLLAGGAVLKSAGGIVNGFNYIDAIGFPIYFGFAYFFQKTNSNSFHLENESLDKGLLNLQSERYKNITCSTVGPMQLGFSSYFLCSSQVFAQNDEKQFNESIISGYLGLGSLLESASFYVMRTDPLPPRKSVFSRMKDKLAEKLSETSLSPQPIPVAVPGNTRFSDNYRSLEDYLHV